MAAKTGNQEIARRYAEALFQLALEAKQIDSIANDLTELKAMLKSSADLQNFIGNASLQRRDQASAMAALAEQAKLNALTKNFLGTLSMNRRLDILADVIAATEAQIATHKGEMTAEVVSAEKLDAAHIASIAAALKKITGMTIKVDATVNADIMGGLIITIGSQKIDSSVRSKLERLHRTLKNPNTSSDKTKMREVA